MNFFNIGTAELLLIFVIALIVVGPRRLPEIARSLGKIANDIRKISQEFTTEMTRELNTASNSKGNEGQGIADQNVSDKPIQSLGQIVNDVRRLPQEFMGEITKELEAPVKELKGITRELNVSLDPKENEDKDIADQNVSDKPIRSLGKIVSDVRKTSQEFTEEITRELEAPVKELKEITREVSVSLDPKEPKENEGKEIVDQDVPRKPVQGDQA